MKIVLLQNNTSDVMRDASWQGMRSDARVIQTSESRSLCTSSLISRPRLLLRLSGLKLHGRTCHLTKGPLSKSASRSRLWAPESSIKYNPHSCE